ncbi:uncharacterized protein PODANS_6_5970 [Podospora anserina S mat+]|uniref:Podospora anserina S mat+ genomic DNA chromosome 6, supercontig 2 n=1 Tax=Podospora anserina (strain S / ATCC MYA-4624 / DSM 980 / FGSC 10383) TaxID=515849 RepID=B2B295_PODAN|nr:uncharacterized protein PODANS_6_5970 [Podospora anserina S mat+]CAP71230.1 unnamed protein product [Podospora anserina S mat+]CDP30629.1 Putative protein of unknown function [Podospora anserina S mat+]
MAPRWTSWIPKKGSFARQFGHYLFRYATWLPAFIWFNSYVAQVTLVNGPSMYPFLNRGYNEGLGRDWCLVWKAGVREGLRRGEVVTFRYVCLMGREGGEGKGKGKGKEKGRGRRFWLMMGTGAQLIRIRLWSSEWWVWRGIGLYRSRLRLGGRTGRRGRCCIRLGWWCRRGMFGWRGIIGIGVGIVITMGRSVRVWLRDGWFMF